MTSQAGKKFKDKRILRRLSGSAHEQFDTL